MHPSPVLTFSLLALCLAGQVSTANATVSTTGDVTPIGVPWGTSTFVYIGNTANGTLTAESPAILSSHSIYLGANHGVAGEVTVTGPHASWNTYNLMVGLSGDGILNLNNGGSITVNNITGLGLDPNSSGRINFDSGGVLTTGSLFASPGQLTGTGTINTHGLFSDADLLFDTTHGSNQVLTFNGAGEQNVTVNLNQSYGGVLGAGYRGSGSLTIRDGITITSMAGILGHSPGSTGVATITGSNSKWLAGNQFVIGDSGRGVLNIANGGAVSFGGPGYVPSCTIASAAGSSGVVTVAGTGSSWQTGEELQIGGAGDGSLDVSAGGTVSSSFGYLGYEGTSTGTATIRGDKSTWNNQSDLYVGRSGNATLYIANGGCVQTRAAYVGYNKGVTGTVTVDGTNSKWTTTDRIYIGHEGNGTLTVAGGATCRSVGGQIGYGSKSTGAVTVTGAGSTWSNSADVHVGILGNGALTILKGASVSNWGAYIGDPGSTKSAVAVDGIGSSWTNNGTLFVGNGGKGTLSTTNGANVRSNTCIIGGNYNSGLVAVDGIGSTFVNTGNVTIGNSGRLSVTGGASVANQQAVINGTVAIDGVGTTWENFIVNVGGGGTLSITGGGEVSASLGLVYISSLSTLAIDVGNGSTLSTIGNGGSAIQNYGNLRILAGAKPTAHSLYSPISANTWSGNGVNQAVGGTWDSTAHEFTVSDVQEGDSGKALVGLNLKNTQRVLIGDDEGTNPTGWRIGASFLASDVDNTLSFTATAITAVPPSGVLDLTQSESVLGAWNLAFGLGYLPRSPAYLSFDIGSGYSRDTLKIWQVNGSSWTPFDATDLNYDGQYANFTMTPFYGYAVTGAPVPEPTALAMILAAGLGGLGYAGRKRRASR